MASVTDLFEDLRTLAGQLELEDAGVYFGTSRTTYARFQGQAEGKAAAGKQLDDILRRYNIHRR